MPGLPTKALNQNELPHRPPDRFGEQDLLYPPSVIDQRYVWVDPGQNDVCIRHGHRTSGQLLAEVGYFRRPVLGCEHEMRMRAFPEIQNPVEGEIETGQGNRIRRSLGVRQAIGRQVRIFAETEKAHMQDICRLEPPWQTRLSCLAKGHIGCGRLGQKREIKIVRTWTLLPPAVRYAALQVKPQLFRNAL